MKKNNKKGFTLVELLVVIAILAILATVSVVGYSSFTKQAKQSNAEQEMSQIKTILLADWLDGFVGDSSAKKAIVKGTSGYTINVSWTGDVKYAAGDKVYIADGTTESDITSGSLGSEFYAKSETGHTVEVVLDSKDTAVVGKIVKTAAHCTEDYSDLETTLKKAFDTTSGDMSSTMVGKVSFVIATPEVVSGSTTEGTALLTAVKYVQGNGYTATWTISDDKITTAPTASGDAQTAYNA